MVEGRVPRRLATILAATVAIVACAQPWASKIETVGEQKKWHTLTITFDGPQASESSPSTFLDNRLQVVFTAPSGKTHNVPGFFAADGNAAESSATSGNKWRVRFVPDEVGNWRYTASFRTGSKVALSTRASAGSPSSFDGASGSFDVRPTDKRAPDLRAKGRLRYVGKHHLQFAETGEYFLKGGADSPENFLGYRDFDGTSDTKGNFLHSYSPHIGDWRSGDPTWKGGKGKGIIGAINYLSSKGMNSIYHITYNLDGGDGGDVWPWSSSSSRNTFDVSKLAQWEIVFTHMTNKGLMNHFLTQETENDQGLDGGNLGDNRKLYYRELIARFGHHLALVWNLGEENTNTDSQRKAFATYIRSVDPYDSPRVVHTHPGENEKVYNPLLGFPNFEGPSIQLNDLTSGYSNTKKWIDASASGRRWVVTLDEPGTWQIGIDTDSGDPGHDDARKGSLWANLMAGGAGVEWYFGAQTSQTDLDAEDWRSRENVWDQTRYAIEFFQKYTPFWDMKAEQGLMSGTGSGKNDPKVLAKRGDTYVVYLPTGGTRSLNVDSGRYTVSWYNPRSGGSLQTGSVSTVTGPGSRSLGTPPFSGDAVALVKR